MTIEGLDEIVVGASLKPGDHLFFVPQGSQQNEVNRRGLTTPANPATNFGTFDAGHHPIKNGQTRRIILLQHSPRLKSVIGRNYIVSPLGQSGGENATGDWI